MEKLNNDDNALFLRTNEKVLNSTQKERERYECFDDDKDIAICYISDLHINYKIEKKFSNRNINELELKEYLTSIVRQLKESLPQSALHKKVILIGDFSSDFEIFKMFFNIYGATYMKNTKTFFILGNHELWDKKLLEKHKTIEEIIEEYRNFLGSLQYPVILLENQLYLPNSRKKLLNFEEILTLSKEELKNFFAGNPYAIFGGLGYAGLNEEYNADSGLYRNVGITREDEIKRSKIIESIHTKLRECVSDKKIFLQHIFLKKIGQIKIMFSIGIILVVTRIGVIIVTKKINIFLQTIK